MPAREIFFNLALCVDSARRNPTDSGVPAKTLGTFGAGRSLRGRPWHIHGNHPPKSPAQLPIETLLRKRRGVAEWLELFFHKLAIRFRLMRTAVRRPIVSRPVHRDAEAMHASAPLILSEEDKLDVLRHLDEFRFWHSLDDKRRCRRCHEEITGRQLLIYECKGSRGGMRLQCPTPGCASTPNEWFYDDPILAASLKSDFRRQLDLKEKPVMTPPAVHDGRSKTHPKRERKTRKALAQMPLLRSIATGLHAIRPVA